jgi:hypothetical protein
LPAATGCLSVVIFWENVSMIINIESKTMNIARIAFSINWRNKVMPKN